MKKKTPNPKPGAPKGGAPDHQDELVQEAGEESFPASDPPAWGVEPPQDPGKKPRS